MHFQDVFGRGFLAVLALVALVAFDQRPAMAQHTDGAGGLSGTVQSGDCANCHQDQFDAWQDSHHGWALRLPKAENVLGDFGGVEFTDQGQTSRFYQRDDDFFIQTPGADGEITEFKVLYTVGVTPLQQYLLETEPGRLQAFDVAWDTQQNRWFHLYPDQNLQPGDGLFWTGPYKNWNGRCAECHQTDYVKGYDPASSTYQSEWSELTIGCGACHGPADQHLEWAADSAGYDKKSPELSLTKGFDITLPFGDQNRDIQICAGCHSRRGPLSANSPHVGTKFEDSYNLALLRDGLYYSDGQINDEVYVYGSFLQSKMYAKGVGCANCHDAHSGELVAEGNATCTQCHSEAGNDDFASLKLKSYDDPSHHHHKAGSTGAQCVSCHMPDKNFMQVDPRRDHSFRVPRPDLSAQIGSPNACTSCHDDRDNQWATDTLKEWFPNGRIGTFHYGQVLDRGRFRQSPTDNALLIELALDPSQAAIVRATAIDRARPALDDAGRELLMALLDDPSDLVRGAALKTMEAAPPELRLRSAIKLMEDPALSVRQETARLLAGTPGESLNAQQRQALAQNMRDFQTSLVGRSDFPETQLQIAGLAMVLRDFDTAKSAFSTALEMDPQLEQAWITLARIQQAQGLGEQAIATLNAGTRAVPGSSAILITLGGMYFTARENEKAVIVLERSIALAPPSADVLDLLANNQYETGDITSAIATAKRLSADFPGYQPSELTGRLLTLKVLEKEN